MSIVDKSLIFESQFVIENILYSFLILLGDLILNNRKLNSK